MSFRGAALLLLLLLGLAAGCSREPGLFVEANARAHVGMLAGTIGSRPVGTIENERARAYIVEQLRFAGFEVRVQAVDARRPELGRTARVANVIATLPGERREALALISHYDSSPSAPGAADAALGVGIALEAARVLAARPSRRWTLMVLLTDGEEAGLMGAAALVTDPIVKSQLAAYLNLEAIGSDGTAVLFQTGPGNHWLTRPWARQAPHPRGGSYALEIYQRLPNDTDFSILAAEQIPGLNFAPVGDSYAYHTARDTPDRLTSRTIRTSGENVVAVATALLGTDITQRTAAQATFFDIGGTTAVAYGPLARSGATVLALALGLFASIRLIAAAIRDHGPFRWLGLLIWTWLGAAATLAAMVGASWLLRAAREVYHPWYARPGRLFVLLMVVGAVAAWGSTRMGKWLPGRLVAARQSALVWSVTLPVWIALAAMTIWLAPAASYLWGLPLLSAGLLLSIIPPRHQAAVRLTSLVVLAVTATLWLRETHELLHFLVAMLGRQPIVTPVWVYAALIALAGVMIVPPLVGLLASERPLVRPAIVTALLLLAVAGAAVAAYRAPAYTPAEPLHRIVRVLQATGAPAIWEVASIEPGLDLGVDAPPGWLPAIDAVPAPVPWGRLAHPFVFRASTAALGPAPADITGFAIAPVAGLTRVTLSVVPRARGLTLSIVLPPGLEPARSSLPGIRRLGQWTATFVAPPPEGIAWEGDFLAVAVERLAETRLLVVANRIPGGSGWQGLPAWLPQERTVWAASASWVVPVAPPPIAPVPPLR